MTYSLCLSHIAVPVTSLASLLSYSEVKKVLPWLAKIIDTNPRFAALVQNTLPSLGLVTFNGFLPFLLECKNHTCGIGQSVMSQGCRTSKVFGREARRSTRL